MGFSSPFLLFVAFLRPRRWVTLHRREWLLLAGMGGAMAGYQLAYFTGIPLAGVAVVVVIALCSAPVMVAGVSALMFGERLNTRVGLALMLAVVGTAWLALGGSGSPNPGFHALGAALALGAGASYASFTLLAKLLGQRSTLGAPQAIAISFSVSAALLLLLAVRAGGLSISAPAAVWLLGAYMGVFPTGIAYLLFFGSLRQTPATIATIVALLEPAVATVLAWLLLGQQLRPGSVGAMAVLAAAVVVLQAG